jgi:hypothetical protein
MDNIRDLIIDVGGDLPVIGGGIVLFTFLAWGAWEAYEKVSRELGLVLGAAAVGAVLAVAASLSAAKASCEDLYVAGSLEYHTANCRVIVTCYGSGELAFCT